MNDFLNHEEHEEHEVNKKLIFVLFVFFVVKNPGLFDKAGNAGDYRDQF